MKILKTVTFLLAMSLSGFTYANDEIPYYSDEMQDDLEEEITAHKLDSKEKFKVKRADILKHGAIAIGGNFLVTNGLLIKTFESDLVRNVKFDKGTMKYLEELKDLYKQKGFKPHRGDIAEDKIPRAMKNGKSIMAKNSLKLKLVQVGSRFFVVAGAAITGWEIGQGINYLDKKYLEGAVGYQVGEVIGPLIAEGDVITASINAARPSIYAITKITEATGLKTARATQGNK